MTQVLNALSVDVEDYFQVSAFSDVVPYASWDRFPCRAQDNTLRLLDVFDRHAVKATFFILGWIAERCPSLVQEIHLRGHEVASHGYAHRTLDQSSPDAFREEIRSAKAVLEDLIHAPVIGFRAPSFSLTRDTMWALEILSDEGFQYDSSLFPIHHDRYGIPDAVRFPHTMTFGDRTFHEFPMSTVTVAGINLPIAGGGYLRLFPSWLTHWGIRRVNQREGQPAIVYVHPWEIDPDQPRIAGRALSRFRHYQNLGRTTSRLEGMLTAFRFAAIRTVLNLTEARDGQPSGAGHGDYLRVKPTTSQGR
ncbi:MAG: XrtA system polysaccharide deacetylase [Nitrospirota bacterium]